MTVSPSILGLALRIGNRVVYSAVPGVAEKSLNLKTFINSSLVFFMATEDIATGSKSKGVSIPFSTEFQTLKKAEHKT